MVHLLQLQSMVFRCWQQNFSRCCYCCSNDCSCTMTIVICFGILSSLRSSNKVPLVNVQAPLHIVHMHTYIITQVAAVMAFVFCLNISVIAVTVHSSAVVTVLSEIAFL